MKTVVAATVAPTAIARVWVANAQNPLNGTIRLPDIPEPTAADLQPFLHDWSAYSPS
ncbi:hypothetical protein AB0892_20235 [Streptomyces sp. NPDC005409]|uniref:hypothetical protein n=1 Tax=Streptomyces sp. NPDC005409 TaxID=3155342 RepID=UPI003456D2A6